LKQQDLFFRTSSLPMSWKKMKNGPKRLLDENRKTVILIVLEVYGRTHSSNSIQGGDPVPGLPGSGESAVNPDLTTAHSI
jgi:hypothetical protein